METLKSQVLAKCEECKANQGGWMPVGKDDSGLCCEYLDGYFQVGSPKHVVCLKFNEETHSESVVWPLAAKILGIEETPKVFIDGKLVEIAKAALHRSFSGIEETPKSEPTPSINALLWMFDQGAAAANPHVPMLERRKLALAQVLKGLEAQNG